jgi:hypothetical protein
MCPHLPLASRNTCLGRKLTPACHTAGIARKLRPDGPPEVSCDPHQLCQSHRSHLYTCLTGTATYSCPPGWFTISHYSLYRPDRVYRHARMRSLRSPPYRMGTPLALVRRDSSVVPTYTSHKVCIKHTEEQ